MVIDVLYTLGPPSCSVGGENRELRWSLRSLVKYGQNIGRVVVVGYPPDWLSDEVVKFQIERPTGLQKDAVIWNNVMTAIDAGVVSGRFLLSSDDHFTTKPFDYAKTPLWWRQKNLIPPYASCRGGEEYRRVLDQTRRILLQFGYGICKCNPHRNTVIDCRLAPEAKRLLAAAPDKAVGLEINSVMGNLRHRIFREEFVEMHDWKVPCFDERAVASGFMSIRDRALDDPRFVEYMEREFGAPCRYERTVAAPH